MAVAVNPVSGSNMVPVSRSTVGDLIMNVRAQGPDPTIATLGPPVVGVATAINTATGTLAPGTYFYIVTQLNPWGESLASAEQTITFAGPNNALSIPVTPDISATAIRVYMGTAAGGESFYSLYTTAITSGLVPGTSNTLLFNNLLTVSGIPPVRASAYLPDADGGFASASLMYRWLNNALKAAARVTGGVADAIGVASVSGQRRYVVTVQGQWLKLNQCFYDGWELDLGNKAETFRNRNLTANISISLMVDAQSDTTKIELYWTPSRTSGTATTTAPVLATDTVINITGVSGWLLADGYALITDGSNSEIITYSAQTSTQLTGVIRGWSGTQAVPFATGASITELNIELNGYRMPYVYNVGQSGLTLGVPPGWEPFLEDYMLGSFRMAEQETDEGQKLQMSATKALEQWVKSNKPVAGPRQARMYGDYGIRGLVPGGLTGGIIIP